MSIASVHEQSKRFKLATIFEVSLYAMMALSSVMLSISEGTADGLLPQSFTLLFVVISFVVVERFRMWFLPWWAAGILGIIALVGAFWNVPQYLEFHKGIPALPEERRLDVIFAGAHLLVYLTWIVLFLEKTNQQFWWLWALCVLQIAVGASQSTESLYGAMLSGYLFLAVWTLSVFSLLQGQQQFDRAQQVAESTQSTAPDQASGNGEPGRLTKAPGHDKPAGPKNRWRNLWRRPSKAIGNVQRDPWASWISPRFVGGVLGTASLAFVLALLFFFLIPRHPSIWRRGEGPTAKSSSVGFSRNLALGDIGQILESTKKVMEVHLSDFQTGEALDIEKYAVEMGHEEPLFRGMVAVEYEDGQWRTWEPGDQFGVVERLLPGFASPRGELVRQQIHLESVDPELLFAMPPAIYGQLNEIRESIRLERQNGVLKRPRVGSDESSTRYEILSPKKAQVPGAFLAARTRSRMSPSSVFLRVPRRLRALEGLAREKSGVDESPPPSPSEQAQRLVNYLRASGEFQYTLDANVQDRKIDPLEDFLINRKVGHCEYFASALALMLRSVGIPSRLVSGFKGGEYDEITGLFVVQERHAHAWVEALIDRHWVILDATPASRAASVASMADNATQWNQFQIQLKDFWIRFIVRLNVSEQRRLLAPIKLLFTEAVHWLRDGRGHFSGFVTGLTHQLRSPERWISWQGGLVTFFLLTFLSSVVWLVRALWRIFQRFRARFLDPLGIGRTIAFYERFRRDCSKAGLDRKPSQTPKEFAFEVRGHFNSAFDAADWGHFPLSLVDAYYDVRYGARELSEQTLAVLENQLARFESLLDNTEAS